LTLASSACRARHELPERRMLAQRSEKGVALEIDPPEEMEPHPFGGGLLKQPHRIVMATAMRRDARPSELAISEVERRMVCGEKRVVTHGDRSVAQVQAPDGRVAQPIRQ